MSLMSKEKVWKSCMLWIVHRAIGSRGIKSTDLCSLQGSSALWCKTCKASSNMQSNMLPIVAHSNAMRIYPKRAGGIVAHDTL